MKYDYHGTEVALYAFCTFYSIPFGFQCTSPTKKTWCDGNAFNVIGRLWGESPLDPPKATFTHARGGCGAEAGGFWNSRSATAGMFTHTRGGRGADVGGFAISWGQWWFGARGFEAGAVNWVLDPFLAERFLLPLRHRSATAHVWTHVMICVEANFPPTSARARPRMCERTLKGSSVLVFAIFFVISYKKFWNQKQVFGDLRRRGAHMTWSGVTVICTWSLRAQCHYVITSLYIIDRHNLLTNVNIAKRLNHHLPRNQWVGNP